MIQSCTIELAPYSRSRTKKGMSAKALLEALKAGAEFKAHNINGVPCDTYCSIRDMVEGTTVSLVEVKGGFYNTVWYGDLKASDFPTIDIVA